MNGTIDDVYFEWLYSQVQDPQLNNPQKTYWSLLREMYTTPFEWFVPNDDNRAEDGKFLREIFMEECRISHDDESWVELPCSFLEMLVALSRRASYNSYGEPYEWFWRFIDNLDLLRFVDSRFTSRTVLTVKDVMERVNKRTYNYDGSDGIFPLVHPKDDQRKIEIWYQLAAYLLEGEYVDNGPRS